MESRKYYTMKVTQVDDEEGDTICFVWPDKFEYTSEYTKGVSNLQELTEIYDVEEDPSNPDENLIVCSVLVDGVECNSCEMCEEESSSNLDGYEMDCTNIFDGASTSCTDILATMRTTLLVLQG